MNKLFVFLLVISLLAGGCAAPPVAPPVEAPAQTTVQATVQATLPVVPLPTKPAPIRPTQTAAVATATSAPPTLAAAPTQAAPVEEIIAWEMRGAFDFFWEQANSDPSSPGYGLIRDRYPGSAGIASIASVGFGLTAYLVGVEKGYITEQEASERVSKTLDTLRNMERVEGFYYHFVDQQTGKRAWESEVSTIDTSILLMGVLSVGEYFGGEIAAKAKKIYDEVNWPYFLDEDKQMFYMAYRPEKGFEGHWDFYAEQLMLYVLSAGSDTHPLDETPYYTFTRHKAAYDDGKPFIHSWFGSLFTYQFSHAWIDFRGYTDKEGANWFENSVDATQAQVDFAADVDERYQTLGPDAWGLTACDGPGGYNGLYGAPPSGFDNQQHVVDDTVPPSGAIGSIIFVEEPVLRAMRNYYTIEKLKGEYGFQDAYNLTKNWYDPDVIGIDKGISLLMLANYENDFVHQVVMKNKTIQNGLQRLQITAGG